MNRLLLDPEEVGPSGRVRLSGRRARHVLEVLRPAVGARLRVGIVRGWTGEGQVVSLGDETVVLEVSATGPPPSSPAVDLVLAVPRPKVLRRTLAAAASLGVGRIDLVNAWRVEKSYLDSPVLAPRALEAAVREGCEQGGGTWVPEVAVHRRLMVWLDDVHPGQRRALDVLLHPAAPSGLASTGAAEAGAVRVVVGPEGGFVPREVETFAERGFVTASLVEGVLRTETAVAVALGQVALLRREGGSP